MDDFGVVVIVGVATESTFTRFPVEYVVQGPSKSILVSATARDRSSSACFTASCCIAGLMANQEIKTLKF